MKYHFISSIAIPFLLLIVGTFSYLVILNDWNFEIASYSIFIFTLVYILFLEQVIPLKKHWTTTKKMFLTDIKHLFFSTALFDTLGKTFALSFAIYLQKMLFTSFDFWNSFPFFFSFIFANLIGEFLPYWYHRISHKGNSNSYMSLLLWKFHSIHHLPTEMNWFKTNWMHPVNIFFNTFFKMVPLLFLGFSDQIIFLVGVTHVVIAYLSHANIRTVKSFWDYLIITPQLHHFHHSKKMEEAKNFGNILPFWDLIFGTYYNRKGSVKDVGVMKSENSKYPSNNNFIQQILYPFTVFKDCCN